MTTSSVLLLCAMVSLIGCAEMDPYRNPYLYQPTGANAGNLGAMVVTPLDLAHGQEATGANGAEAAAAVHRLLTDKPHPLAVTNTTAIGGLGPYPTTAGGTN